MVESFGCCRGGPTSEEVVTSSSRVLDVAGGKGPSALVSPNAAVSNTFIHNNYNVLAADRF